MCGSLQLVRTIVSFVSSCFALNLLLGDMSEHRCISSLLQTTLVIASLNTCMHRGGAMCCGGMGYRCVHMDLYLRPRTRGKRRPLPNYYLIMLI
jgi:hypothetical protein